PPSKSNYWKYFIRINEGGKCNICQQIIKTSGNTTNLRFHLMRTHPKIHLQMKNSRADTNVTSTESSPLTKQRKLMTQDETDAEIIDDDLDSMEKSPGSPTLLVTSVLSGHSETSVVSSVKKRQSTLDFVFQNQKSFHDGGTKTAEFTNYLIFMIAKDNLPFAIVEKEGFKTFMRIVAPLYKIPSRKKITSLVEEKYEFLSGMIKTQFSNIKNLCLTTDIWTDTLNTKSFLGLTAHFILKETYKSV
ncbi:zinc finger BED domain-containing protein 1-like, partial [Formica exsecta]|uniref:zinc finger BED domain-containing protein 1-like n=1 Tax=Formica exsecta TaxID=72781 RepID=UPI00114208FE